MQKLYKHARALLLVLMLMAAVLPAKTLAVGESALEDSTDAVVAIIPVPGEDDLTYSTLEAAIADSLPGDIIVLTTDYTLTESVEIPAEVQLTIPTSADYNDTIDGNNVSGVVTSGSAYATLTVPAGKTLTVKGTLLVAGNQQASNPQTGVLTGNYGELVVDGTVELTSGSKLYARGKVSGDGTINAASGSNIYQLLQIHDWRGGTATSSIYSSVFPFNLYDVNNVTAKMVFAYGSHMYARYYVIYTAPLTGRQIVTNEDAMILGNNTDSGSLFKMTSSDAKVTVANATNVTVEGDVSTGPLTIIFNTVFGRVNLSTENMTCPIYKMNVTVTDGASMTITDSLKFLPGASLSINNGGDLIVNSGKAAYFYTAAGYSSDYYWKSAASVGTTDAELTVGTTATVSGVVGSTSNLLNNTSYETETPVTSTQIVKEATQVNSSTTIVNVTFYTYTAAAASATEEAVEVEEIAEEPVEVEEIAEEPVEVEEIIEEPVEIIEIVEIEEAPIAA